MKLLIVTAVFSILLFASDSTSASAAGSQCRIGSKLYDCSDPYLKGQRVNYIPGCTGAHTKGKRIRFGSNVLTCSGNQR